MTVRRDYLRVFIPLAILYGLYNITFTRWLDQNETPRTRRWETIPSATSPKWWEGFFKEDSWQRHGPQSLETESAILLYKDRIEISERRWQIKPLTILIPQGNDANGKIRRAVFIENPEGAEIQFQSRPEWNASPPPLETGLLLGKTLIYSPPERAEDGDGLKIETSEIRIENRKIWTDKAIKMSMGDSEIEGRHLTILLAQKILSSDQPKGDRRPFDGLDSMELFYVDRVRVGLKPGGLWPSKSIPDANQRPAHALLKCGGRFEFKFHQREAVLYGGVNMEHIVHGLPIDTFDCDELHLKIGLRSTANSTVGNSSIKSSPWTIEELTAYGALGRDPRDPSRWLKLNAPSMQAQAMGLTLFMDFVNGQVALSNTLPMTMAKDSSRVYLRREALQVWCPEVQYHNPQLIIDGRDPKTISNDPPRLGLVSARGPGTAQLESASDPWTISWGSKLQVRPDGDKDLVTVDGSANVNNRTEGHFSADHLDLWLHPVSSALKKDLEPYYADSKVPQWLPDRMKADRNVEIESPTIQAHVDSMKVAFLYPAAPGSTTSALPPKAHTIVPVSTRASNTVSEPRIVVANYRDDTTSPIVRQPYQRTQPTPIQGYQYPNKPTTPFLVNSKSLDAVIRNTGGQPSVHQLMVQGDVTIRRNQLSESAPWLFEAKGEQFRLQRTTEDLANVHLTGSPATIGVGSGWIVAPEFSFSQTEHAFWIDHPGELLLPSEAIPLSSPGMNGLTANNPIPISSQGMGFRPAQQPTSTTNIKWLEAPRLKWGERMVFDGQKARFGGNISLHCKLETSPNVLWHIAVHSGSLGIDMVHRVPLDAKDTSNLPKSEIATITFENDVDINAFQTDSQLNRISREHMKLPRLDVYVPGQSVRGYGPGELWTRRFGGSNPLAAMGAGATRSNDSNNLQCLHLTFMRGLEGDYRTKTISFLDRVEALMGPIANWDQELNVQYADSLAHHQTHLIADRVDLFDSSDLSWNRNQTNRTSSSSWEVKAVQRVAVRTQTDKGMYSASGDELKYDSGTDIVRISGAPQKATILIPNPSAPSTPLNLKLGTFAMQLKTGNFEGTIGSFEGQLPTSMQRAGTQPAPIPQNNSNVLPSPRSLPNRGSR